MSVTLKSLAPALQLSPNDFLVVDQGTPPITRLARLSLLIPALAPSTGQVDPTNVVPMTGPIRFSQLPVASTVYSNDLVIVEQGDPPITRIATIAQLFAAVGAGVATNVELNIPPIQDRLISQLPRATSVSLADWTIINQGVPPTTRKVQIAALNLTVPAPPPTPVADFSGTPLSGVSPLPVTFTDLTTLGPTAWAWTFGDGATSTLQNPSHTYAAAGLYSVSLTATVAGLPYTATKPAYITVTVPPVVNLGWNPLDQTALPNGFTLSNANKTAVVIGDGSMRAVQSANSGKRYFEVAIANAVASQAFGFIGAGSATVTLVNPKIPGLDYTGDNFALQRENGQWGNSSGFGGGGTEVFNGLATNYIIGVAVDFTTTTPTWHFYIDGVESGAPGYVMPLQGALFPMMAHNTADIRITFTLRVLASELAHLPATYQPWIT